MVITVVKKYIFGWLLGLLKKGQLRVVITAG